MKIVARISATSFIAYCDHCGQLRECHQYRLDEDLYRGACREPLYQPCLCHLCRCLRFGRVHDGSRRHGKTALSMTEVPA